MSDSSNGLLITKLTCTYRYVLYIVKLSCDIMITGIKCFIYLSNYNSLNYLSR